MHDQDRISPYNGQYQYNIKQKCDKNKEIVNLGSNKVN